MSYKINGIDVSTIIKNSTVASIPGQPYVGFPVTTNSPTMRSINGPTNNQIPTSGQTSYVIGTDSLDMKQVKVILIQVILNIYPFKVHLVLVEAQVEAEVEVMVCGKTIKVVVEEMEECLDLYQ